MIYDSEGRKGMDCGKCLCKRMAVLQNRLINVKKKKKKKNEIFAFP